MDVTSIGDVNVDIITSSLSRLPERDTQAIVERMYMSSGGCAANFARATAGLGLKTRLIAKAGEDFFGSFVRDYLSKTENLELRLAKGSRTGITFAMTFPDQTRSFVSDPGGNGEFSIDDLDYGLIEGRYVHVASFFLQGLRENTRRIIEYAHERGMLVSFDTGYDPAGWTKEDVSMVRKVLKDVDIFFPNLGEAEKITGEKGKDSVVDALFGLGVDVVGLKMGKTGSYVCDSRERVFVAPYRVDTVDTTGAGDVFDASFVYGHSRGWGLEKIGRFANASAALSTEGYGSEKYPSVGRVFGVCGLSD